MNLESNSPDILAVCETHLDDLIDSGNFSVMGYLLLLQKDFLNQKHGLVVYMKEGLLLPHSYVCFQLTLFHSLSYCFLIC